MGVPGLTSFVNGAQNTLAQSVQAPRRSQSSEQDSQGTAFIVDGWAWFFRIWTVVPQLRSLRNGSLIHFHKILTETVLAWQSVGLQVTVVFDGAYPLSKFNTIHSRMQQVAASNDPFMRLSPASRDPAPLSMRNPLARSSALDALRSIPGVEVIVAKEEADPLVVSLARQREGYAVSQDSDYYILGCQAEERSYLGYVPLESVIYAIQGSGPGSAESSGSSGTATPSNEASDGFEEVKKGRNRNRLKSAALVPRTQAVRDLTLPEATLSKLPPKSGSDNSFLLEGELLEVRFQAYHPARLAKYLQIPAALLPLVAAVLGNDHTDHANALFRSGNDPTRTVANCVREQWNKFLTSSRSSSTTAVPSASATPTRASASTPLTSFAVRSAIATPKKATSAAEMIDTPPLDPLHSMVVATLNALQAVTANGHAAQSIAADDPILETIIKGIDSYHLSLGKTNATVSDESTTFFEPRSNSARRESALEVYRTSFRAGYFDSNLVPVLTTRTYFANIVPEDPDSTTVNAGPAAEVMNWVFTALFDAWGMDWARETMEEPIVEEENDFDDLAATSDSEEDVTRARKRWIGGGGYQEGQRPEDVISVHEESSTEETSTASDIDVGSIERRRLSLDLDSEEEEDDDRHEASASEAVKPPPAVTVWLRRGGRLVAEARQIQSLVSSLRGDPEAEFNAPLPRTLATLLADHEMTDAASESSSSARFGDLSDSVATVRPTDADAGPSPLILQPLQTRVDFYLHAMRANTLPIQTLEQHLWPLVATLRLLVAEGAERHGISRTKNNWTIAEVRAVARAACRSHLLYRRRNTTNRENSVAKESLLLPDLPSTLPPVAPPTTRAIHLVSSFQIVLQTSDLLAQALGLRPAPFDGPDTFFESRLLFYMLSTSAPPSGSVDGNADAESVASIETGAWHDAEADELATTLVEASMRGLDESSLGIDVEEARKARKAAKKRAAALERQSGGKGKGGGERVAANAGAQRSANPFELLEDE